MNILCLQGSPRHDGHTVALLSALTEVLAEKSAHIEVVHLSDLTIDGCRGCESCRTAAIEGHCIQKDDMTHLYDKVLSADALVLASPVYFWHMSAFLKTFIDRLYCISEKNLAGKKLALVLTGGGDAFDGLDLIVASIDRMARYCGLDLIGTLYRAPSGEVTDWDRGGLMKDARDLAHKITN